MMKSVLIYAIYETLKWFFWEVAEFLGSADLGGSSKYSNESFEVWSGERFHVNLIGTWVSRS